MPDNVPITPGAGAIVATDQLPTGEQVQYMKLMDGTLDSSVKAVVLAAAPVGTEGGLVTRPIVASLPLPAGAAQEHTAAALPHAVRISDGATFLDPRDISDRAARLVGHVTVDAQPAVTQGASPWVTDDNTEQRILSALESIDARLWLIAAELGAGDDREPIGEDF